ncbi:FAD-linked oxidase [Pandoraea terrae]|uniref:FAD-linked oxidase n=1 Tax=Pandoraea terrae TaxID=1537710 RepID=A0A5E4RTV7_9BURK|nr:FAD-binding oxidoreductase [Pandoraea terrae]VVD65842.1 FAD-linked oxidase [Pandoraea terrae]
MTEVIAALREALGDDAVRTGEAIGERHHTDWSGHAPAQPRALLLPRTTEEVAAALRICDAHRQSVVPQGGMTGLAGAAVPTAGDIVLSLERMSGVEEIDPAAATLTVLAGTPLQVAQEAAAAQGFELALDFGARGSCQIGGNIATNAGGLRVIQSGMTRDLLLGLEVVLADGTILSSLNKMVKNNTGYDLKQLFVGSEGTLGVITRAVLRLSPPRPQRHTALCALADFDGALALLGHMRRRLGSDVGAFELMWPDFFDLCVSLTRSKTSPFAAAHPMYVLVEMASIGGDDDAGRFAAVLGDALEDGIVTDAVIAQSASDAAALWEIRECTAEFPVALDPINLDISLPIGRIGAFVDECRAAFAAAWPVHRAFFFGHIGDSNLHVTVDGRTSPGATHAGVDDIAYALVRQYGGSVSAEHGIGVLKRPYLSYSRMPAELATMRRIKQALDPNGILNPGKVL